MVVPTMEVTRSSPVAPGGIAVPGPILLLGAPGAGKGTQAQALMTQWSIPQISTGDLLRSLRNDPVKSSSSLGRQIRIIMDAGRLVPDELVEAMVTDRLQCSDTKRGYVLDGFPRTLPQATWLDATLARSSETLPVVAVSIRVDYNQLLRRVTGRRTCPACGRIYNIYTNPPSRDGLCDSDGAELVHRTDDTVEVFSERIRTYEDLTAPVVVHYRTLGRFAEVDGDFPVAEVTQAVANAILGLRG